MADEDTPDTPAENAETPSEDGAEQHGGKLTLV